MLDLNCGHFSQCAARFRVDLTSHIWFGSFFFSKEGLDHIIQNQPRSDLDCLSCFGQMYLVWKQANVQESSGPVLAKHNWPATSFPLSDSVAFFHRLPRWYCAKPAWIWFGSDWLYQVLAKQIWSRSKLVCKNHLAYFWPVLQSWSWSDADWIWHIYWVCA